jgi:hypothetical protein
MVFARATLIFSCLLMLAACSGSSEDLPRAQVEESKQRGDKIIAALKQFHADRGTYPRSLSELVPNYMKEIQPPTVNPAKWHFNSDGNGFSLKFGDETGRGAYVYRTSAQDWWMECSAGF